MDTLNITSREEVLCANPLAREWETLPFHRDRLQEQVRNECPVLNPWADSATLCLERNRLLTHATGLFAALHCSGIIDRAHENYRTAQIYLFSCTNRTTLQAQKQTFFLYRESGSPTIEQVLLMGCQGRNNDGQGTTSTESDLSMLSTSGISSVESSLNELMVYLSAYS